MASPTTSLPSRAATSASVEDAVPDQDPTTTAGLLAERLQAWKHAVSYLQDYVAAVEKVHGRHAKDYEKVLKTISSPLREGHHFDQSLGGVAGFFENLRQNTQAMINTNIETEKSIKGSVVPILDRLHKEIKHKAKELESGAHSGAREVEKLRNTTQKHIELLGQQTAAFDAAGGGSSKLNAADDPYLVHRGVLHRLGHQVIAENNQTNDLISVQNNFAAFEAHIIEVLQEAVAALNQLGGGQADKMRALYNDVLGTIQRVPGEFEWASFAARSADRLTDPQEPARSVDAIRFPNMDHAATRPLIEGSLERKSRNKLAFGYSTAYYVVTPSRFLHELREGGADDARQEPKPELSIYLPDAVVGSPSGDKFTIRGKDRSRTLSSKLSAGQSEFAFKAHTPADAQKWCQIIQGVCGAAGPAATATAVETDAPDAAAAAAAAGGGASSSSPTLASPTVAAAEKHDSLLLNTAEPAAEEAKATTTTTATSNKAPLHAEQEAGVVAPAAPEEKKIVGTDLS